MKNSSVRGKSRWMPKVLEETSRALFSETSHGRDSCCSLGAVCCLSVRMSGEQQKVCKADRSVVIEIALCPDGVGGLSKVEN